MKIILSILIFILLLIESSAAQSLNDQEFAARLNRLNSRLSIANTAVKTRSSDLELVGSQKDLLVELRKRHQIVVKEYKALAEKDSGKARQFLIENISELEKELTTKILLPHQVDVINEQLFQRQLTAFGGNLIQTMLVGYRDQLGLSESQLLKLQKLNDKTKKRILEAKAKFQKELEEIRISTEKELRGELTENQLEVLSRAKGAKPKEQ